MQRPSCNERSHQQETSVGLQERSGKCHSGSATKTTTLCSGSPGEGHVILAVRPAHQKLRICPPQRCFQGCSRSSLWLAIAPNTFQVSRWSSLWHWPCHVMLPWGLPVTAAQRDKRPAGRIVRRSLLRHLRGATPSAAVRGKPSSVRQEGWRSSAGHPCARFLGYSTTRRILWCEGVLSLCAVFPQFPHSDCLPTTWNPEEATLRTASSWCRERMFHPACLHYRRRNGTGSDSLPEKTGKPAQRTSEWALLHSDGMAPVRHIVLSSEVELSLHSRLPQTWPDGHSERTWHLRSGRVSTHCGQLGLIHHFLHAQPTPVDICYLTKFLVHNPFWSDLPPLFLPFSLLLMSLCSPLSNALISLLYALFPLCVLLLFLIHNNNNL